MVEVQTFFAKLWESINPFLTFIWVAICWVMFPDAAYVPAAIAVGAAVILDILTKFYALAANNGGYIKATKNKIIYSDILWRKTKTKLFAYLVVMILSGLSMRVAPLEQMGIFVATIVYSVIFLRECQSNVENLIDAGAEWLVPFLFWLRKKERGILKSKENETEEVQKF